MTITAAVVAGGATLAAAPAQASPLPPVTLPVPVNVGTVGLLPLSIERTVDVGTVHVLGGPAGRVDIPVATGAKVRLTLDALNPLLALTRVAPCPNGELGTLVDVRTIGSAIRGTVAVTTTTRRRPGRRPRPRTVTVPIHVGPQQVKTVGVCLQGVGIG